MEIYHNQYCLKEYAHGYYKLSVTPKHQPKDKDIKKNDYDGKLHNSISRARSTIFEYALCNDFSHFITLTLDGKKYNRSDLENYIKDLGQFIRDERKRTSCKLQYILIPELHKDGKSWHMHGLINGLPEEELTINSNGYLTWLRYQNKFGYNSISTIKNPLAVSKYITKYVTKSFNSSGVREKNKKLYYCSRGLRKANRVLSGLIPDSLVKSIQFDYTSYLPGDVPLFLSGVKELDLNSFIEISEILLKRGFNNEKL